MSVHTTLTTEQVNTWLQLFSIGELTQFEGISAGITNTIYKVDTEQGEYVLTLFEHLSANELPFFIELQKQLVAKQVVCPGIIHTIDGQYIQTLRNKPAMLSEFLPGQTLTTANAKQCQALGVALAQLHTVTESFTLTRHNPFDFAWHEQCAAQVFPRLNDSQQTLLQNELQHQQQQDYSSLRTGICHMDLFMDNVLFTGDDLSGILDFYYACNNFYALDLATAMCAWSITPDGINLGKGEYVLVAYQQSRALELDEMQELKNLQRYTSLHFWLMRLHDKLLVPAQKNVTVKPPEEMQALLELLRR